MALLTDSDAVRVDLPHEPGSWVELRRLTWGRVRQVQALPEGERIGAMFIAGVAAWSYDAELTPENLDSLDMTTANFIAEQLEQLNGVPSGKGPSSASVSSTSSPEAEPGQRS